MADPIFGFDEIDPGSEEGGGKPVSLSTTNPNAAGDAYWSNYFASNVGATRPPVGLDLANQDQSRGWQQQLMQGLQRQAAGDLNSNAQQALRQGYTDARAGQSALGSATRGAGGAAGLRQGMMGAGNVQRGFAGDQQMLKLQEQQAAQAMLAQMLAQQRSQDSAQAQAMAANSLGNQNLNNAMTQFYLNGGISNDAGAAQIAAERARASLGFDLEGRALQQQLLQRYGGAAAGASGAAATVWGGGGNQGTGYRQVDGQNSIVPDWDK